MQASRHPSPLPPDPATRAGIFGPPDPATQAGILGPPDPATQAGILGPPDPATQAGIFGPPDPATQAGIFGPPDPATQADHLYGRPARRAQQTTRNMRTDEHPAVLDGSRPQPSNQETSMQARTRR